MKPYLSLVYLSFFIYFGQFKSGTIGNITKQTKELNLPPGFSGADLIKAKKEVSNRKWQKIKEQTAGQNFKELLSSLGKSVDSSEKIEPGTASEMSMEIRENKPTIVKLEADDKSHLKEPDSPASWTNPQSKDESFANLFNIKELYEQGALPRRS